MAAHRRRGLSTQSSSAPVAEATTTREIESGQDEPECHGNLRRENEKLRKENLVLKGEIEAKGAEMAERQERETNLWNMIRSLQASSEKM